MWKVHTYTMLKYHIVFWYMQMRSLFTSLTNHIEFHDKASKNLKLSNIALLRYMNWRSSGRLPPVPNVFNVPLRNAVAAAAPSRLASTTWFFSPEKTSFFGHSRRYRSVNGQFWVGLVTSNAGNMWEEREIEIHNRRPLSRYQISGVDTLDTDPHTIDYREIGVRWNLVSHSDGDPV